MKNTWIMVGILFGFQLFSCSSKFATQQFSSTNHPPKPDYNKLEAWAVHPNQPTEILQQFKPEEEVDVFFVYPTLLLDKKNSSWNADITQPEVRTEVLNSPVKFQASAWAGVGRLFVPFYRQAHIRVYSEPYTQQGGLQAFDLAYEDVRSAFETYLKSYNHQRPIIIASHSQGSGHAKRLLREFFDGKPLQKQLVAAYLIGARILESEFKHLKPMQTPDEIGGYVSWNSYKKGHLPKKYQSWFKGGVTSNPITWDGAITSNYNDHKGVYYSNEQIYPQSLTVEKIDGMLWVSLPKVPKRFWFSFLKNYHFADINLFWEDIRQNALLRSRTFLNQQKN